MAVLAWVAESAFLPRTPAGLRNGFRRRVGGGSALPPAAESAAGGSCLLFEGHLDDRFRNCVRSIDLFRRLDRGNPDGGDVKRQARRRKPL